MLELIAQGTKADLRWRRLLPATEVELGRATEAYRVPWDSQISRRHVSLFASDDRVQVRRLPDTSNPVFFEGQAQDAFELEPGQHFVIGSTTFTLADDRAFGSLDVPNPISQKTFSPEFLRQVPYRDADRRIDVLNRIPEAISSAGNTEELLIRLLNTMMAGIASASTIGIVQLGSTTEKRPWEKWRSGQSERLDSELTQPAVNIIQWDRRGLDSGDFQPSETLIRQAVETGETVLHIWNQRKRIDSDYTFDYENDWAFVCPISSVASPGWGIYVAGTNRSSGGSTLDSGSGDSDLQGDIKFCELVGSTLRNLLLVKQLERQQSSLRAFFSPIVRRAIAGRDPDEVLAPRKCDVSVLFCDLRGFSKTSEQMADDLLRLLARVSEALGVTTSRILEHRGVIGDFHGDSAMGFWGWPLEPKDPNEGAVSAMRAALQIQQDVAAEFDVVPTGNQIQFGMGIASGQAVAGKIGTRDQVKVTTFGPVVNLASRLEGMTRWLNSSVLADRETVNRIIAGTQPDEQPVCRCLGRFQPFGMASALDVFQISQAGTLEAGQLADFAAALQCFQAGDWIGAKDVIARLPSDDSARRFMAAFMSQHDDSPPEDWDGVVRMQAK